MHSHTEGEGSRPRPFEGRVSTDIIWNSSTHKSSMALWVFILFYLDYNPIRLYFVSQIVMFSPLGALPVLLCPFDIAPWLGVCLIFVCFVALPSFLALQGAMPFLCISAPVIQSALSPRSPGSSHWKMVSETKPWVLGPFVSTGVLFLSGLFSCRERKYIYKSFCT